MWFARFRQAFFALTLPWALTVITQSLGRIYLFAVYSTPEILHGFMPDVWRMFRVGLLFDIRSASILFGICLLISGVLAVSERSFALWKRIWPWLATLLGSAIFTLTIVNIFYYATYDRAIDVFIFGLVEDDTRAILSTLWQDYPVLRALLCLALFAVAVHVLCRRWQRRLDNLPLRRHHPAVAAVAALLMLSVTSLGARGSLGTFPLRQMNAQVSEVMLLNFLAPNGMMALHWAFGAHRDYGKDRFDEATDAQGAALLKRFLGRPTQPSLQAFSARTAPNPVAESRPPHVVLTVMESMGYHLTSMDRPDRDLLGALRPHWESDWRFERFLAEGSGTIDSLVRLLVRSPINGIGQSRAQAVDFTSNMLKPYRAKGYKIIFVTSGNGSWRNLTQFLLHQKVDELVEQTGLQRRYPDAPVGAWGIPDSYMFRYIEQRLQEADQKNERVLIVALSTTHHPPYHTPKGYPRLEVRLDPAEKERLAKMARNHNLPEVFSTLRYANDQLGRFLSWVKGQPLGARTIVAVTGDHNIRGIGYPDTHEQAFGHAVPFYLYVPQAYREGRHFDPARVGSHKDIWPTLYQLSLSDTPYYRTGCDLLAPKLDEDWCLGYNPAVIIAPEGAYIPGEHGRMRPWAGDTGLLLGDPQPMTPEQAKRAERWYTYTDLLAWQLNRQVHGQP